MPCPRVHTAALQQQARFLVLPGDIYVTCTVEPLCNAYRQFGNFLLHKLFHLGSLHFHLTFTLMHMLIHLGALCFYLTFTSIHTLIHLSTLCFHLMFSLMPST